MTVQEFKQKHNLTKTVQGEMFGRGSVGDRFELIPQTGADPSRLSSEREAAQLVAQRLQDAPTFL